MEMERVCGNPVLSYNAATSCKENIIKVPYAVFFSADTIASVGENPSVAEFQAVLDAGTGIFMPIVEGVFIAPETTPLSAEKTFSGVEEIIKETNGITGTIVHLSNQSLKSMQQNTLNYATMYMWVISRDGRVIVGGKNGKVVPNYITSFQADFVEGGKIPVTFKWERTLSIFDVISDVDLDYKTLTNLQNSGTVTLTDLVGTSSLTFIASGFLGITGWDKIAYPTLYPKVTAPGVVTLFSDVARSTGALATIDTTVDNVVTEANSSGFGGTIVYAAVIAVVVDDTFDVAFTGAI